MTTARVLVSFQVGVQGSNAPNNTKGYVSYQHQHYIPLYIFDVLLLHDILGMSRSHLASESVPCCTSRRRDMEQHTLQREKQLKRSLTRTSTFS